MSQWLRTARVYSYGTGKFMDLVLGSSANPEYARQSNKYSYIGRQKAEFHFHLI
jgi:hypothetical protein